MPDRKARPRQGCHEVALPSSRLRLIQRGVTDMFAVHPTNGTVTLTGKLNFSETKLYKVDILP